MAKKLQNKKFVIAVYSVRDEMFEHKQKVVYGNL